MAEQQRLSSKTIASSHQPIPADLPSTRLARENAARCERWIMLELERLFDPAAYAQSKGRPTVGLNHPVVYQGLKDAWIHDDHWASTLASGGYAMIQQGDVPLEFFYDVHPNPETNLYTAIAAYQNDCKSLHFAWSVMTLAYYWWQNNIQQGVSHAGSPKANGQSIVIYTTSGTKLLEVPGDTLTSADLSGRNLDHADLHGRDLQCANLSNASLRMANLCGADLRNAMMTNITLDGTQLDGARFENTTLDGATFYDVDLRKARFKNRNSLIGTNFSECKMSGVKLAQCDLTTAHFIDQDTQDENMQEMDLSGSLMNGCFLCRVDLRGATLAPVDMRNLIDQDGIKIKTELDHVDLRGADLRGADLRGAKLRYVTGDEHTKLGGTMLDGVDGSIDGVPSIVTVAPPASDQPEPPQPQEPAAPALAPTAAPLMAAPVETPQPQDLAASAPTTQPEPDPQVINEELDNSIVQDGDVYHLCYDGIKISLAYSVGLDYLAILLGSSVKKMSTKELSDRRNKTNGNVKNISVGEICEGGLSNVSAADLDHGKSDEVRQTLNSYNKSIRGLRIEKQEADECNDRATAERCQQDIDNYIAACIKLTNRNGRPRIAPDCDSERARVAVTIAIKRAIKQIGSKHQPLADHLSQAVQTGTYISYLPDPPTDWNIILPD